MMALGSGPRSRALPLTLSLSQLGEGTLSLAPSSVQASLLPLGEGQSEGLRASPSPRAPPRSSLLPLMDVKVARSAPACTAAAKASPALAARPRFKLSPMNVRRLRAFKANKRGYHSFIIFMVLFVVTLFAEFIANDKPFLVKYDGALYVPIFKMYTEKQFGGEFETEADYRDPAVQQFIHEKGGWIVWPPIPYSYRTIKLDLPVPAPAPPSWENLARHRRPGPRRARARDLRLPHLRAVRLDPDRFLGRRRRHGRRGAGLFRRLDRSFAAALHRNPGLAAAPLYPS